MTQPLSGRTALVTGSGRGLGRAIADRLAELGANLVLHDVNEEAPSRYGEFASLADSAQQLSAQHSVSVLPVTADIADPAAVRAMAAHVHAAVGTLDILVNCAGGDIGAQGGKPNPNDALHISYEDMRALIDRNLLGTMLVSQAFCIPMAERGRGSVVNIASGAAHFGTSPEVVYSSIKAAVVHYTRCLAYELRPRGVRVNAVSPGPTKTARFLVTRKLDEAKLDPQQTSLDRYAEPAEIADAVAFLAGDAARFVHGQILRVDGGLTLYA